MKMARVVGAAAVAAVSLTAATATPAYAARKCTENAIYSICADDSGVAGSRVGFKAVIVMHKAGYAGRDGFCWVSSWAAVRVGSAGKPWYTPTLQEQCTESLAAGDSKSIYTVYQSGTSATQVDSKTCVSFYAAGALTPFDQVCDENTWHTISG
jgi:hypothetical protein